MDVFNGCSLIQLIKIDWLRKETNRLLSKGTFFNSIEEIVQENK